jgi:hypothetical protein
MSQMNRAGLRSLRFRHAGGDLEMEDDPTGVRTRPAGIADVGAEAARLPAGWLPCLAPGTLAGP